MMSNERMINLVIAEMTFPIKIQSEREEEMYRKAAKRINDKLNKYRVHFQEEGIEKLLAMVAFEFSYNALNLEDKNDTRPFKDKLKELTDELEKLFREEK